MLISQKEQYARYDILSLTNAVDNSVAITEKQQSDKDWFKFFSNIFSNAGDCVIKSLRLFASIFFCLICQPFFGH